MEIDSKSLTGNTIIPINQWYHLAFVYSGKTATIYVNGGQSGKKDNFRSSSSIATTRLYNSFGSSVQYGDIGDVQLDEIKLYNQGLTQAQVQLDKNTVGFPSGIC
jgi:hypothetical protein